MTTRILLVEDNRADARLFAELLREVPNSAFALTVSDTLAAALAAMPGHDVVFLDLSLPDAHGTETLTRALAVAGKTPIVVLTGNDDDRVAMEALKAGAQDYLKKGDITPSLIARTAWYAIERKKAEEHAQRLAFVDAAARRARFVSAVANAATASFELDKTLVEVAKLLVPTLADYCVIDLVHGERIDRVAWAAHDPRLADVLGELSRRYVPKLTHPHSPVAAVVASRRPLLVPAFDARSIAPDEQYVRDIELLGPRSMLVVPLVARDRAVGAITLVFGASDRTYGEPDRHLAEEVAERIALGIDNAQLYASAQRAIRGRDDLLAVVSHDLRNPLGVVALALQMIEREPAAIETALPRAKRGIDKLQRLIEDLLDVARIENGTLAVDLRTSDLAPVVDDAFELHKTLAASKGIRLVREIEPGLGAARIDRHRFGQALANLIGNAIKFTPKDGVVRLVASTQGEHLEVAVTDSGMGIAPEHVAHIFDRFWQRERRGDGVGLGLAIVKGILDAHGAAIEVDSTLGQGSRFRILLPRVRSAMTVEMPPLSAAATTS